MANPVVRQPLALQNGIYLTTTQYGGETMHPDNAHVKFMNGGKRDAAYLGVISQFATTGFKNVGNIWDFNLRGAQVMELEDSLYEWDLPESTEDFMILEDLSGTEKAGRDGQTFKLRVNMRGCGNNATVKFDRFSTLELQVTDDEIVRDGRTWIMTFRLLTTNGADKFVPKMFLQPNTRIIVNSSHFGEFDTVWNDTSPARTAMSRYYNYVGETDANTFFSITDKALNARVKKEGMYSMQEYRKLIEMWVLRPGSDAFDYSLKKGEKKDMVKYVYGGDSSKASKDIMKSVWVPEVEALSMARLKLDVELEALFGAGGQIVKEGNTYNRPLGAFFQLNKGYKHFYNIHQLTWARFNAILTGRFKDRIEPFKDNVIDIYTGWGGINLVNRMLSDLPGQYGMMTSSDNYIQGGSASGSNQNLHFSTPYFRSAQTDIGKVNFIYKPSFDPVQANSTENPMVNGFRLSSYIFMITDITGKNDHIYELKNQPASEFRWIYENGKSDYMGSPLKFHGKLDASYGFRVGMTLRHKAYWVSDPTRAFMLLPYSPFTGIPYGQDFMDYVQ